MANTWQKTFAAIPLTVTDKEPLKLFRDEYENNSLEALENLLSFGYKISVLWSNTSQSFIVSVIGTDECKHNKDKVLSSFTDDLEEAFFMAAYKVLRVASGGEWPVETDQSRWG